MSAIHTKSLTGITSITTPPGVDNVFTVHSNDTTERFRVDLSGNQNISGIVTASNFKTGVSNLHNLGLTLSSGQLDIGSNIKAGNAGVITATAFHGSGANLTGITAGVTANTGDPNNTHSTNSASALTSNSKYNTIFGWNAGNNISTGDQNTIYGYRAGGVHNNSQETIIGANCFSERSNHTKAVGLGYGAGMWNQGANNTAIGYESVGAHGTSNGDNNTGVGYNALRHITDGDNNVALGYQANNQHTTGSNCIVIGANADSSSVSVSNEITLGDSNINHLRIPGIGVSFSEGGGVTTGIMTASAFKLLDGSAVGGVESDAQYNTVAGTNAGNSFSGTSAVKNTLFGYNSGTAITSGDQNTSFGYDALKTMTTTESNTAVGFEALRVATGDLGAAFGSMALRSDNGNGYNCAFGAMSGYSVTSGSDNSFLGYTAGQNLQTGNYNICLGAWSRTSSTSVSRECTIGGNQNSRTIQSFRIPGIGLTISSSSNSPFPTSGSQLHLPGNAEFVGVVTATSFNPTAQGSLSHRNIAINGAMDIAQRGTASNSSAGYHTIDRWEQYHGSTDEAPDFGRFTVDPPGQYHLPTTGPHPYREGFRYAWGVTNGNQTSGAGADDNIIMGYAFEARDIAMSGWEYTNPNSFITLSFWIKSSVAQEFYGQLLTQDGTIYNYPFGTGSLTAFTWKKVVKTIPGNANITFNNDNGAGLRFYLWPFAGTNLTGNITNDAWMVNNYSTRVYNNTTTWYTTNDASLQITGFQLEVGSVATPFEFRSHGEELQRCERYYQRYGAQRHVWYTNVNGTDHHKMVYFPTTMRTSPTMNLYNQSVDGSSVSASYVTPNGYSCRLNGNGRMASWKHEATAEL